MGFADHASAACFGVGQRRFTRDEARGRDGEEQRDDRSDDQDQEPRRIERERASEADPGAAARIAKNSIKKKYTALSPRPRLVPVTRQRLMIVSLTHPL